jgi:signal transduction histidine kinase
MSIRLRLTVLYSVILALTLVAFSAMLYLTQSRATYDSIKDDLVRQVSFTARSGERIPGQSERPPQSGVFTPAQPSSSSMPSGTLPGRWMQWRALDGTIIGQTFDLSGASLPLSTHGLQTIQGGSVWFETAQVQDEPLLIYSERFTAPTGVVQIVQVAYPIAQAQQALDTLRLTLVFGCSFAIVLAFISGWLLAGAVLQPIQRITVTAQAIGAEHNFSRRVEHKGPTDEVGQLAITFNNMLAELESGYRQLEGALESQRRFVADASHELRTPLTTVRGNIELLQRQPPIADAERAEVLADTTDEVERLIRLVNQLLVLARVDAGQPLRSEAIPLPPLLEDVCRQARLIAPRSPIVCEPPPDVQIVGDRDALKQVLLILVDNAHVHTAPGTEIRFSVQADGDNVAISVHDAGPGIAPNVLPHIFERFYRGDVARSGHSTGLGLAIAKELVEKQGGVITVSSEVGKGSAFTVVVGKATDADRR